LNPVSSTRIKEFFRTRENPKITKKFLVGKIGIGKNYSISFSYVYESNKKGSTLIKKSTLNI